MDYMHSTKPMLISYSGFVSLINEADCGVIIPSENVDELIVAINTLFNMNEEKLSEMGERGKKHILENRTFDKLAEQYMKIF